jgi:hypothetical protein
MRLLQMFQLPIPNLCDINLVVHIPQSRNRAIHNPANPVIPFDSSGPRL